MRLPFLSLLAAFLLGAAAAQTPDVTPQVPIGQSFTNFKFPVYQDGELKATLSAARATGITLNRAETTDLKVDIYEHGRVTTTITSPKADVYMTESKMRTMRTRNTVDIERADISATAQTCDFDLLSKKYLLRDNVHVVLKHFSASPSVTPANAAPNQSLFPDTSASASGSTPAPAAEPPSPTGPVPTTGTFNLFDSPGSAAVSSTNNAPTLKPGGPVTP
jgi:hypothetical protein